MLVQFSVKNYLSFKELATLSLVASNLQDTETAVVTTANLRLLKTAAVYGANASGKSNLLKALAWMTQWMRQSSKESQAGEPIDVQPYALSSASADQPSFFEIVMQINDVRYRYGFEVDRERVVSEWLYHTPKQRERMLYERTGQDFSMSGQFAEGRGLAERTRLNSLFLSVAAQFNGDIAGRIMGWVRTVGMVQPGQIDRISATTRLLSDEKYSARIGELIKSSAGAFSELRRGSPRLSGAFACAPHCFHGADGPCRL
ncbi:MAG: AAA family ATPase [Bacilli bacterium]